MSQDKLLSGEVMGSFGMEWGGPRTGAWALPGIPGISGWGWGRGGPEELTRRRGAEGSAAWSARSGVGELPRGLFRGCFPGSETVCLREGWRENLQLRNVTFNLTLEPEHLQICLSP